MVRRFVVHQTHEYIASLVHDGRIAESIERNLTVVELLKYVPYLQVENGKSIPENDLKVNA